MLSAWCSGKQRPNEPAVKRAVFLDRDGTLIHDPGYLRSPGEVRLLPEAREAIRRLNDAGILAIVVTNQSGIARGLLTLEDYQATARRLEELLRTDGAHLDAQYFCPHLPEITGPCDCRKPGTLLYRQAAERFSIDPGASWWVGDRLRDVEPSRAMGGRGILLRAEGSQEPTQKKFEEAPNLAAAVSRILRA